MKKWVGNGLNLIYPPICLECEDSLQNSSSLFCDDCHEQLSLIDPTERCHYCFESKHDFRSGVSLCKRCSLHAPLFRGVGAAFDYEGPAATLVKHLKYLNKPYLAEGAGAFLAYQFFQLQWPIPDLIIPVPLSFMRNLSRGYNQAFLLANAMGNILNCPVAQVLKRKSGDYSQAALDRKQRMTLEQESFFLQENGIIRDKTLLIIDDVRTTGATLNRCAETLLTGYPAKMYGLTLCHTDYEGDGSPRFREKRD
ncbi:ComF family protein [Parachlamydia acanthamoebae]|uniref:ComF family protein n=1 Tax=Parachlamydia acanthamoebae TaxID=83552 RepID=UPI0003190598|nr:phosphoribosyltransferase family protein [Parachlamydia acanthamoebae]